MINQHGSCFWLEAPADRWLDAFPLGNGRIGAMVFGGTAEERIGLNHENLWRGKLKFPDIPEAYPHLKEIREAFLRGDILGGTELANQYLGGPSITGDQLKHIQPYQPFGDLYLHLDIHGETSDYRRELNLRDGISTTSFKCGKNSITRRIFISAVHQIMVLQVESTEPLSGMLRLDRIADPDAELRIWSRENSIGFNAGFTEGLLFSAQASVNTEDGKLIAAKQGSVQFRDARHLVVHCALATDYHGIDPSETCANALANSPSDYAQLLSAHIKEHRALYDRASFELDNEDNANLPLDKRIEKLRSGGNDPALFALYFNYARYLLIASSRNCDQPANLQGIWNEEIRPPWQSDFHADINLQMNYWHAELCGLMECSDILYAFLDRHVPQCRQAARRYFNSRGLFYQSGDIWKMNWMSARGWDVWTGGAAWFAQHFWWRWLYTRDKEFLRTRAYPFIRECAEFYEDFLVKDNNGCLVTIPSQSPENRFVGGAEPVSLCIGATMDYLLIREVLENVIEAARILEIDSELRIKWKSILEKIPDFQIGRHGQLQEWQEDYDEVEPGHRHISHLYGVHPGNMMTPTRLPEFFKAARVSLERRMAAGGGHTGWSRAWVCCWWARFGEPELAFENLSHLLTDFNTKSLLDTHPLPGGDVFQIDGNFGGATAIAELLLQFHDDYIHVLPCLPKEWPSGRISGWRIWGGFEVDIKWSGGVLEKAAIRSHADERANIKLPAGRWIARCGHSEAAIKGGDIFAAEIPVGKILEIGAA